MKVKIIFNINLSRSVSHRATHFARWVSKRRNMNHASLFSGIGGAEVAASMMGWQNLFHCEIQEFPRKVLDYWFPNSISYEDITKTDFHQWHGKVDVLTGGFPCQPFSLAGRRNGADDNRYLWPQMLRAIRQIHPTWVVGENVAGIKTMVESCQVTQMGRTDDLFEENHIYREESRFTLDKICADLEAEGYSVQPIVIPACSVGAPHRRDRVWIVARRISTTPSNPNSSNDNRRQRRRANKQKSITECCRSSNLGTRRSKRLASHPYCNGDKTLQPGERTERKGCKRDVQPEERSTPTEWTDRLSRLQQSGRWRNFPTQSPVCRGNDGIPFDVDSLTISFPKWRQESIKAYGNAWVPQVAYEIFRAIEAEHLQWLFNHAASKNK